MKYGRIMMALAGLTLAACGKSVPQSGEPSKTFDVVGIYRSEWSTETKKDYLRIEPNSVTLVRVCKTGVIGRVINKFKGVSENRAQIEVTVPARITETTIELLGDAEKSAPEIDSDCVVKLNRGAMSYLFNYYHDLFLTRASGGASVRFERLGEAHMSISERIDNLPVRAANALGAPQINAKLRDFFGKDTGVAATELNDSMSKDVGTAVTNLKGAVSTGARKALEDIGNNPPMMQ